MEKKLQEKGLAEFDGMSVSSGQIVTLKLKLRYDEMLTSVNLLQALQTDVTVQAKVPDEKAFNLGIFSVNSVSFDKDGNAKVCLKALVDNVEINRVCQLASEQIIQIRFLAVLELPDPDSKER